MNVETRLTDIADASVREAIFSPFIAYNTQQLGLNDYRLLIVVIEDVGGSVIGGLWGRTAYDWLFIEFLFVPESLRGQGIDTELMVRAESEARIRGCHSAWLDTFEFQARGFYERLGYSCFGELSDYPTGYSRYFFKKVLTDAVPSG